MDIVLILRGREENSMRTLTEKCQSNFNSIFWSIALLLLMFSDIFGQVLSSIRYLDELLAIYSIAGILLYKKYHLKSILILQSFCILGLILVTGFCSNILYGLQNSVVSILIDAFGMLKAAFVFYYLLFYLPIKTQKKIISILTPIGKAFILLSFIFGVINLFYDIGMSFNYRYGIRTYRFIFQNPGSLNLLLLCFYAIIVANKRNSWCIIYFIMVCITTIFTLRGSALGTLMVLVLGKFIVRQKKMSLFRIIPLGIGAICLGWNQLYYYIFSGNAIRSLFYDTSFIIGKRFFPIGTGFSTFGSDQAFRHYSPLYYEFGFDSTAVSPLNGAFANDTFWPMLIAQFGFICTLLYMVFLALQLKFILKQHMSRPQKVVTITLFSSLIIASLGSAIYTSSGAIIVYGIMALLLNNFDKL